MFLHFVRFSVWGWLRGFCRNHLFWTYLNALVSINIWNGYSICKDTNCSIRCHSFPEKEWELTVNEKWKLTNVTVTITITVTKCDLNSNNNNEKRITTQSNSNWTQLSQLIPLSTKVSRINNHNIISRWHITDLVWRRLEYDSIEFLCF